MKSFVNELIVHLRSAPSSSQLIRILASIGPDAADALPLLRDLRDTKTGEAQFQAIRAIRAIDVK